MEKFLNNLNDKSEPLWVRALDIKEYDQLLLEDAVVSTTNVSIKI